MFNVVRTYPAPASLARRNSYRGKDVIEALRSIFHNKCYLCEQDSIADPEVEHFRPHNDEPDLMYGWDNLYFSCRRCNSIKSNHHVDLLNCSDANLDVFNEIVHYAGNAAMGEVEIRASKSRPSQQTENTVNLIYRCFNEEGTSLREISKESLLERLLEELAEYSKWRTVLASRRSTPQKIQEAKEQLTVMCSISYPFSVFWKWHLLKDVIVTRKYPLIREELGF
ncbi:HNH endonuclease [Enterobacter hormaechei]|uniref:hypothetical protein n=1 Tax=Enterobacter hormaechei TaxID=158836 RepID=UPI00094B0A0A|nr:hypothetical protein [Enterobacter hormaechei]MCE1449947.1 HNH endonuclease [Enterobacter hormaechei]MCE1467263.1 HNH endonuclease [Enterobacter hormaechei]HEP0647442.1 HNH endonuclease [Enterobacter hormaechei subsp. xiangfangensis]